MITNRIGKKFAQKNIAAKTLQKRFFTAIIVYFRGIVNLRNCRFVPDHDGCMPDMFFYYRMITSFLEQRPKQGLN